MNYQPSEIADLLMMLVLGPITLVVVRRIVPETFTAAGLCAGLMFTGYVSTIVEGFFAPDFFNLVEHASFGLAGLAFVWVLTRLNRTIGTGRADAR